jgi:hypothetical protein
MGLGQGHGALLRAFLDDPALKSFISDDLAMVMGSPVRFVRPGRGGKLAVGYNATILPELCDAILAAREAKKLTTQRQLRTARQCEILTRAFAKVGIIALIDEVTGYQKIRARHALEEILDEFIAKGLRKWAKTFPDEFYEEMFRLRGWQEAPFKGQRPAFIGKLTNDIVYARLAPLVLTELRKRNPVLPTGRRQHKHFQWLTEHVGNPRLREHLSAVIALMKVAKNWNHFYAMVQRALPLQGENLTFLFDEPLPDDRPETPGS